MKARTAKLPEGSSWGGGAGLCPSGSDPVDQTGDGGISAAPASR